MDGFSGQLPVALPILAAAAWIGCRTNQATVHWWTLSPSVQRIFQTTRKPTTKVSSTVTTFLRQTGAEWAIRPEVSVALLFSGIEAGQIAASGVDAHTFGSWTRVKILAEISYFWLSEDGMHLGSQGCDRLNARYLDVLVDTGSLIAAYPALETNIVDRLAKSNSVTAKRDHELVMAFREEFPDGSVPSGWTRKLIYARILKRCSRQYDFRTCQRHLKGLIDKGKTRTRPDMSDVAGRQE